MKKFGIELILTQEQLEDRLAYWQQRLRLQDWLVSVEIATVRDMDGYAADVERKEATKQARIRVMGPGDDSAAYWERLDMELLLVHELLHLHHETTSDLKRHKIERVEQGIEAVSQALIALERLATWEPK